MASLAGFGGPAAFLVEFQTLVWVLLKCFVQFLMADLARFGSYIILILSRTGSLLG